MCGIFGYVGYRKNAPGLVFEGLKSLEYRGYDSWGVAVSSNDRIFVKKKAGKIGNSDVSDLPQGSITMGHTRWATHGGVTDINAHPHLDCKKKIAVIHNGIFENYLEIKKKLLKRKHKFVSETDTETISHMIEEAVKSKSFPESVRSVFNQMEGLNAVIAINANEDCLVTARNGSPLVIGIGEGENFLASDASALLPYTKNVYFLEDNQLAVIYKDRVEITDASTGREIPFISQRLNWKVSQGNIGKFQHYMLKEIHEQPKVISEIIHSASLETMKMGNIVKKAKGTYLVGCGTASYACLTGSYLFSKIAGMHINWAIGSEFGYHLDFLNKDSLVIAVSQSGETMDILESVKKAKAKRAKILGLVNVLGSSLYRMSDYKMLIGAGPEKAVASTKAMIGMLSHLVILAHTLNGDLNSGKIILNRALVSVKDVLTEKSVKRIKTLVKRLLAAKNIFVIGRGISYPTALETALKIKEISYIHAEGLAAGELKHGPLALVEKGVPCISFLPNDETYGANLAAAMEMKARGGYIIGISYKPHEVFDYFIPVKDAGEATIIPNIVVGQLLSYYLAVGKGLDPDKPRNLAKSVTVK
jgi:glucosamine--fructose-6-phosphate aminotransferase (isomerizing)